jgi:antitoxin component of MazEF toxin-antitoxin module
MSSMESKVFQVRPNSKSLRGTIPQSVVDSLKLKHGDRIKWSLEAQNDKIIAKVEKCIE